MELPITLIVSINDHGQRVDKFFATNLIEICSRMRIQKSIVAGLLKVNGVVVDNPNYRIQTQDHCQLYLQTPTFVALKSNPSPIDILFEDADLLVINKPAGQVVHLGKGVEPGTTLTEALLAHCSLSAAAGFERPGVVHRLDQATSGVILFAKTDAAYWALTRLFADRRIRKTYHALVYGIPRLQSGTIEAPIGRSQRDRTAMCVTKKGRYACTHWEILEVFSQTNRALLTCYPITGRTHQIRVHLKSIGHPILGDSKYGKISDVRLYLHAYKIEFPHPISQANVSFIAPWPEAFKLKAEMLKKEMR